MSAKRPTALALIDGEHYPEVVRDALAELQYTVLGAVLLGGTEKIRGGEDYGVPLHSGLEEGLARTGAELVVDLSDEPVLDARGRLRLASRALAAGRPYVGADFRFEPVALARFDLPSLAVVGSGKRVGKTAVAGHLARLLSEDREVVVVAMGRGGPRDPVVIDSPPSLDDLLELSRGGSHAASDYLEDAALANVVTIGCRRCGGGLAGQPFISNVEAGARAAAERRPDLVIFEGSGTSVPPVAVDARVLVAGAAQDPELIAGFLGAYRLLISDLVLVTGCEEPLADPERVASLRAAIRDVDPELEVVETVLRPRPVEPLAGKRVAFFSTAPAAIHDRLRSHLRDAEGTEVVMVSGNLSRREALRADLLSKSARAAEVFLVELKAAAIDVVAEAAEEQGVQIVLADNAVIPLEDDLDARLRALAPARVAA
ncbi:MAG TPA: 2,3-diphosphoglycerate synthetase [Gaiellaceae bacterium]|nr:2,3-diphosphoglycerate synthetase [Gaiellaceae bacterium]